MFENITNLWETYGFDMLVIISVIFLFIYALSRIGKKGSYDKFFTLGSCESKKKRGPPKDSKGEIACRNYLENTFSKSFAKARPDFLRNPVTGGRFNLELDCYNPEMKLAVEYQGIQHYKFVPYFHQNKATFENQKYRDHLKRMLCEQKGITLIEVPYSVNHTEIDNYLERELVKLKFL